jgi:hypothetical protein
MSTLERGLGEPRRLSSISDHQEQRTTQMYERAAERAQTITDVRDFLRLRVNENGGLSLTPAETDQIFLMLHV